MLNRITDGLWINNNTSISGDISSWSTGLNNFAATATTMDMSPEQNIKWKKEQIKSIIGDDKYLLQEILSELRKEKLDQLKENMEKHE